MTPYDACKLYLAVKQHFTSNYDYFKYRGVVSLKPESFELRKDKWLFSKLAKHSDAVGWLFASFSRSKQPSKLWVGNLDESDFVKMNSIHSNFSYRIMEELKQVIGYSGTIHDIITINPETETCEISNALRNGTISIDSVCCLNMALNVSPYWEKHANPYLMKSQLSMIEKYTPFLLERISPEALSKVEKTIQGMA